MICSTDPIADMLTRMRNALMRQHQSVVIPYSQIKERIGQIFKQYKFIASLKISGKGKDKAMLINLIDDDLPISPISNLQRISRPGRRVHVGWKSIPQIKNGRGMVLISTDQGIMTGQQARKKNLGGEVLCSIY